MLPFNFFQATVAKTTCKPYIALDVAGAGVNAAIAVLLAAVNVVLGSVIRTLTLFERHRSHTEEHASLCWKTTVAQFLNTSVTPLIASAEIRWLAVVFGGVIFKSGYPDFTTNWCALCPPSRSHAHTPHQRDAAPGRPETRNRAARHTSSHRGQRMPISTPAQVGTGCRRGRCFPAAGHDARRVASNLLAGSHSC